VAADPGWDFDRVEVNDVSRLYGRRRALSHVHCAIASGEIVGLLGPNGAGKSTLIGVLATLVRPTGGDVRYGGRPAREAGDALRGRIGVLGHDLFLYADLTARENLLFFGRLCGVASVEARVGGAAAARLTDRANDRVSGFSRGLRQRLALERALVHSPRLVLLDEPFTGLDDESSALLVARLRSLRATGAIVVMATHDFERGRRHRPRHLPQQGKAVIIPGAGGTLRERAAPRSRRRGVMSFLGAAWLVARKTRR
jgi:ABC-type multidrug transport system ATPase subunit